MKKIDIFPFLLGLTFLTSAQAQSPISITAADMPQPADGIPFNFRELLPQGPVPLIGTDQTYDYSTNMGGSPLTGTIFYTETLSSFVQAGIDMYYTRFKYQTSQLPQNMGFDMDEELDFNGNGVLNAGYYVRAQSYGIGALTGSNLDSLKIPVQGYLAAPLTVFKYPFTYGDTWTSTSRRKVDFTLSVQAMGMNNTPGEQVFYLNRTDSIVGWGKARFYTAGGASVYYDVLIDKISQWEVDSFYLGGQPAPPQLGTTFGIVQGQVTGKVNRYNFYRKGSYSYLFSSWFGANPHSSNPQSVIYNTDGLTAAVGIAEGDIRYSSVLYPNPVSQNQVNLILSGKELSTANYQVTDMLGRTVQTGSLDVQGGHLRLDLDAQLPNGNYFIHISDKDDHRLISEPFMLSR